MPGCLGIGDGRNSRYPHRAGPAGRALFAKERKSEQCMHARTSQRRAVRQERRSAAVVLMRRRLVPFYWRLCQIAALSPGDSEVRRRASRREGGAPPRFRESVAALVARRANDRSYVRDLYGLRLARDERTSDQNDSIRSHASPLLIFKSGSEDTGLAARSARLPQRSPDPA